jgi:hypothetical protein
MITLARRESCFLQYNIIVGKNKNQDETKIPKRESVVMIKKQTKFFIKVRKKSYHSYRKKL